MKKTLHFPHMYFTESPKAHAAKNTVLISINEETGAEHNLDEFTRLNPEIPILRLKFSDIEEKIEGYDLRPMNRSDANKIIDFIERHNPETCFVHCFSGVSRSPSICLAFHYIYGAKINIMDLDCLKTNIIGLLCLAHAEFKEEDRKILQGI